MGEDRVQYDRIKYKRRSSLTLRRNRNIKRVILGIFVFVIVLGIGNHFLNNYREKIYSDKRDIMNINQGIYYSTVDMMSDYNDLMIKLMYDLPIERDIELGKLYNSNRYFTFSSINYDYETYRKIDRYEASKFINGVDYMIQMALHKDSLTPVEKEKMAVVLEASEAILDDYYSIVGEIDGDEEYWQEMDYLYYYKGEMLYMMVNSIAVHSEGVDLDFIEEVEWDYPVSEETYYTEEELTLFGDQLHDFLGKEGEVEIVSREYDRYDGDVGVSQMSFDGLNFDEGEQMSFFYDGSGWYRNELLEKPYDLTLTKSEAIAIGGDYIKKLNQPMLKLYDYDESEYMNESDDRYMVYRLSYVYMDGNYVDNDFNITIRLLGDGSVETLSVSDGRMFSESYIRKYSLMTEAEVVGVLPDGAEVGEIYYMADDDEYYVRFGQYGQEFVGRISGDDGEILSIDTYEEYILWWVS